MRVDETMSTVTVIYPGVSFKCYNKNLMDSSLAMTVKNTRKAELFIGGRCKMPGVIGHVELTRLFGAIYILASRSVL